MKRKLLLLTIIISSWGLSGQIRLVEDIVPGNEPSNPFQFLEHDNLLFIIGQSITGPAIFLLDSNESISIAWQEGGNAYDMVIYNNELYFNANNRLHRLNRPYGTGAGSTIVDSSISMWGAAFVFNGELYFGGELNQTEPLNPNHELMAYNGVSTRLVEEESSVSLDPSQFVLHLGELYFVGRETATIEGVTKTVGAIYKSDGITIDLVTFFEHDTVSYLTSLHDDLYFLYRNGVFPQPYNLWVTNSNGTIGFGRPLNFAFGLTTFNDELFYFDADNTALISRDISGAEDTIPVTPGFEYPLGGFPLQNDSYLSFSGFTNALGNELYIYEPNSEIRLTEDYNIGPDGFLPVYGSFYNNKLYITGDDGSGIGRELHVYNPNCTETVTIPDSDFEAYLENVLNAGDGILGNGLVCKEQLEVITSLNLSGSENIVNFPPGIGIIDLSGIEHFTALETLRIEGNSITNLNLSQNTNLRVLRAWRNGLQTLNVEGLVNLETVGLNYNGLSVVDFSTNKAIQELDITDNNLTSISMGNKTNLGKFTLSNNTNLSTLNISGVDGNLVTFDTRGNSSLLCIEVSSVIIANSRTGWQKEVSTSYSENCNGLIYTSIPDTAFENYLIAQGIDSQGIANGRVLTSDIQNLFSLDMQNLAISNLSGIEDFTALQILNVNNNSISTVDISANSALTSINIQNNLLSAINVDQNVNLTSLSVGDNSNLSTINLSQNSELMLFSAYGCNIQTIDISLNTNLEELYLSNNQLTNIDLSQNKNLTRINLSDNALSQLDLSNLQVNQIYSVYTCNTGLSCISVSDVAAANSSRVDCPPLSNELTGFIVDTITVFSLDCNATSPFQVSANLNTEIGNNNIEITEGKTFTINFSATNTLNGNISYNPIIEFSLNGAQANDDFIYNGSATVPNTPFNVNINESTGSITIEANDDGIPEEDEIYSITISSPDTSVFVMVEPTVFNITVKDKLEDNLFDVNISLSGDVVNLGDEENPDYQINEGGTILISLEASNISDFDRAYFLSYADNYEKLSEDFIRDFEFNVELGLIRLDPLEFENPDNTYEINVIRDNLIDADEEVIQLTFGNNPQNLPEFRINNLGINEELNFSIKIIDVDNQSSNQIIANFTNTGGTEGEIDTFSINLTQGGNPWLNNTGQDIIFPIQFTNERLDGTSSETAEEGDYTPISSDLVIKPNTSSGNITIDLVEDIDKDHEFFLATILNPNSPVPISIANKKIEAKIIDKENWFEINVTIIGTLTYFDEPCCPKYSIEEGQLLEIRLEAEKGVADETPFDLNISYDGSAVENTDFRNRDTRAPNSPENIFGYEVKTDQNPDNIIEILMLTDIDANEEDNFSFSINSTNPNKYKLRGDIGREMDILDVIPASIETKTKSAFENPLTSAEMIISLDTDITTLTATRIFYKIETKSTAELSDYKTLPGYVDIPAGSLSSTIIIEPIDDKKVEDLETVIISIVDGPKYSVNESKGTAQVTIQSDDIALYTASIKIGKVNQSREADSSSFAEVILELNNIPTTDIEVFFKVSELTDVGTVIENEDFIFYQDDKQTIIPSNEKKVIFKKGLDKKKAFFIKALEDSIQENNESIFLEVNSGESYSPDNSVAEIILISSSSDTSIFDPTSVTLLVKNPKCPGTDQKGTLEISNASPFIFNVNVKGLDGFIYEETLLLDKNDSNNFKQIFENLSIGRYEVNLSFNQDLNISIPENSIPPIYTVEVTELQGISVKEQGVSLKTKTGNFIVSGSTFYEVNNNGNTYQYSFKNIEKNIINIPLEKGINTISISGETICLGTIKKEVLINDLLIFPNPTYNLLTIFSQTLTGNYQIEIFDLQGRLILKNKNDKKSNNIDVDVSNIQKGMYMGRITSKSKDIIEFKFIKK